MPTTPADDPTSPLEWVFPYLLDWNACGDGVLRFRVLATIARWIDTPAKRSSQYSEAEERYGDDWPPWAGEWRENVLDLVNADVQLDPTVGAARLGRFFMDLQRGNLVTGFHTKTPPTVAHLGARPGYGFVWHHWTQWFPGEPVPWPFWMFPVVT